MKTLFSSVAFTFVYLGGFTNLTITPIPGYIINNGSVSSFAVGMQSACFIENHLTLFPNPLREKQFYIKGSFSPGNYQVVLFDLQGRLLESVMIQHTNPDSDICVPVQILKPACYLVGLHDETSRIAASSRLVLVK